MLVWLKCRLFEVTTLRFGRRTFLEVPVQTRDGRLIAVQISLPQRFPDVSSSNVAFLCFSGRKCTSSVHVSGPMAQGDIQKGCFYASLPPQVFTIVALSLQDPPVLSVDQPIRHPALDGNGRLKLQALQFWHPGHRLVDVVREAQTTLVGQTSPSGGSFVCQKAV